MTVRTFAVVYETTTKNIRRLIDTSDDSDDSHLERVKKYLAADETMEIFRQADFPVKFPRFVAPFIGEGALVDKSQINTPIDATKIADVSVAAATFTQQEIAKEISLPGPGIGIAAAQAAVAAAKAVLG